MLPAVFEFARLIMGRPLLTWTPMTAIAIVTHSSSPGGLLFWCGIGFFAGIGLFFYGFKLLQRRRLILDTPFSKIRSASMGMVEISGQAVGPYTMIAPITGRPCYYFRTVVSEYKQRGKNSEWVKVAGDCMHVPFFVDDNTGRVLVDPRGAELDLHCDFKQEFCDSFFTTKEPAPPNVREFLARHGVMTGNKIRVEEYCIKPKNSLFILGTLAENPGIEVTAQPIKDADTVNSFTRQGSSLSINATVLSFQGNDGGFQMRSPGFQLALQRNGGAPKVTQVFSKSTQSAEGQQKVADALLKAGISNPAAWAAAGIPSGSQGVQVMADPAVQVSSGDAEHEASNFELHPPVVLMKGVNDKAFMISWRSQQEVARSLGWKCMLMIWGGPVLALGCLYLFLETQKLL